MVLDLVALGLLLFFAWRGASRGALATGLSLVALVAGNIAAWWVATPDGDAPAEGLHMPLLLAAPVAGTLAFVAVWLAIAAISWAARRGSTEKAGRGSR